LQTLLMYKYTHKLYTFMSASQYVTAMSSPLVISSITKLVLIPMFMNLCPFTQQSEVKQSEVKNLILSQ